MSHVKSLGVWVDRHLCFDHPRRLSNYDKLYVSHPCTRSFSQNSAPARSFSAARLDYWKLETHAVLHGAPGAVQTIDKPQRAQNASPRSRITRQAWCCVAAPDITLAARDTVRRRHRSPAKPSRRYYYRHNLPVQSNHEDCTAVWCTFSAWSEVNLANTFSTSRRHEDYIINDVQWRQTMNYSAYFNDIYVWERSSQTSGNMRIALNKRRN
jgi:hypothetical protein